MKTIIGANERELYNWYVLVFYSL